MRAPPVAPNWWAPRSYFSVLDRCGPRAVPEIHRVLVQENALLPWRPTRSGACILPGCRALGSTNRGSPVLACESPAIGLVPQVVQEVELARGRSAAQLATGPVFSQKMLLRNQILR